MTRPDSAAPPEANPELPRPSRRGGFGPSGFARDATIMAWRWLTRMRTALYLLGLLALLTMIATVIPQEPNVPSTVRAWRSGVEGPGTVVSGLIDVFGAFDVYGSTPFLALLVLLFLSLTACLIPRIRAWLRLVRRSQPPLMRHLGAQDAVARFTTDRSPAEVHSGADTLLTDHRWRVRLHAVQDAGADAGPGPGSGSVAGSLAGPLEVDDGSTLQTARPGPPAQVAAEKGLWSREGGSLVFHLSFYVLVAAIVFGQLLTFEGQRGVVEQEVGFSDTALSYWTYRPGRWFGEDDHAGWRLDLDDFHVDWVRDPLAPGAGQPTVFASDVTIIPRDGEPFQATISGNAPLNLDGTKIHQLDWGYAPRVVVEVDDEVVHDAFLHATATDGGFFRTAVKAPSADPDVGLEVFFYPFAPPGDDGAPQLTGAPWDDAPLLLYRQWRGDLQLGATQQTINELDTTALASEGGAFIRPGQSVDVEGVTVSFPEVRRWVGFQVSSRPQIPWLLLGSALLVAGLIASLYSYRRRLWVLAVRDEQDTRTLVTVTGRAFQRPEAFEQEHADLVRELATATGGTPSDPATTRDDPSDPAPTGVAPEVVPR